VYAWNSHTKAKGAPNDFMDQNTAQMIIYRAMVSIDGVRSYMYVRADNMSQAFDCALMRTSARNPQSYVEVLAAQELHGPVDIYIRSVEVSITPTDGPPSVS
jgi:hypothetical protein